jgi:N-methylhydantoinase B
VSANKAKNDYGVIVGDPAASESLREQMKVERGEVKDFDMGPPLDEILATCEAETGLPAPVPQEPLPWAPMESDEEAMRRVRELGDRQMTQTE